MEQTHVWLIVVLLGLAAGYMLVGAVKSFRCLLTATPYRWAFWDGGPLLKGASMGWGGSLATLVARLAIAAFLIAMAAMPGLWS